MSTTFGFGYSGDVVAYENSIVRDIYCPAGSRATGGGGGLSRDVGTVSSGLEGSHPLYTRGLYGWEISVRGTTNFRPIFGDDVMGDEAFIEVVCVRLVDS